MELDKKTEDYQTVILAYLRYVSTQITGLISHFKEYHYMFSPLCPNVPTLLFYSVQCQTILLFKEIALALNGLIRLSVHVSS
jgi:hypothetical protein